MPPLLTIRDSQMHALAAAADRGLEERMRAHLRSHFPDECQALEPVLELWVREGIAAARGRGLASERHLCKYLGLTMVFGLHFAAAPHLDWVRAVLDDPGVPSPGDRLERLYQEALHRLAREEEERSARDAFHAAG